MIDPTSIAGLTLAACDALLKLGERTAQLVHDARSFQDDTGRLYERIRIENTRTQLLQHLLFESSPIYGSLALFEKFSLDAQDEIRVSLDRAVHTLKEASEILEKHSSPSDSSPNMTLTASMSDLSVKSSPDSLRSPSPSSLRSPSPSSPWKTLPKTSLRMLKWSFHDKKRTTEILTDFSELNSGIHEKIKLLCLASDIGLDIQHLRRLQHDENSIQLGFNIDATLQLTARDAQAATPSSELDDSWGASLAAAAPIERCFSLLDHRGRKYLQEHRHCESSYDGQLNQRTRARVDELAKLLHQPKELVFCIPRCIGWKYLPTTQSVAFVFELPSADDVQPEPQSLFRVLGSKDARISLGDRFRLALALARCVSQLHMVKWVHESFRSQNILFFPERRPDDHPDGREKPSKRQPSANIDYGKPAVLGFEYSRPEVDFSYGLADNSLDRDVYRHPDRQGTPEKPFSKIHDIYALGVVLLEIGLWQPAITLEKNQFKTARNPYVIKDQLVMQAQRRLGGKMGQRYQDIVVKCLSADFGVQDDTKEDLRLQQAFRTQVVDVLEKTVAYV